MKFFKILTFFFIFALRLSFTNEPSIIFYNQHELSYQLCEEVLQQAKLFNPTTSIYFIDSLKAQSKNIKSLKKLGVSFVPLESLHKSTIHKKYIKASKSRFYHYNDSSKDPFKRWFVLYDLISHFDKKNIFFVDIDTLLYTDLKEYFGVFQNFYPKLAAPFESEETLNPTILYIHDQDALKSLNKFILKESSNFPNTLKIFGSYRKEFGKDYLDFLPILPDEYVEDNILISVDGNKAKEKKDFSKNFTVFKSVFDSSAIGEYLAGFNLELGFKQIGYMNNRSVLNPYHFKFEFQSDDKGRKIPYMCYKNSKIKINNLKIESKQLDPFLSFEK